MTGTLYLYECAQTTMEEVNFDEKLPYIINYVQQQSELVRMIQSEKRDYSVSDDTHKDMPTKKNTSKEPRSKVHRKSRVLPSQLMEVMLTNLHTVEISFSIAQWQQTFISNSKNTASNIRHL
jgi:hypothetical protein